MKRIATELLLLAPSQKQALQYFKTVHCDTEVHASFLQELQDFRESVYVKEGFIPQKKENVIYSEKDSHAWHLISQHRHNSNISGCIRILFFEKHERFPSAEDILRFGGIEFRDNELKADYLPRIQKYIHDIQAQQKPLVYIGGMAVNERARKLGAGAILSLGANVFARIVGDADGVTIAQTDKGGSPLFQKMGGYVFDEKLTPFYCQRHNCYVQFLGLTPYNLPAKTEKIAKRLEDCLKTQTVIADDK
jgi:hypothetical protein